MSRTARTSPLHAGLSRRDALLGGLRPVDRRGFRLGCAGETGGDASATGAAATATARGTHGRGRASLRRPGRARLDGRPASSQIARGTDEAIVEGRKLALRGSLILQATRAIDVGDGAWGLPCVETTLATSPTTLYTGSNGENP